MRQFIMKLARKINNPKEDDFVVLSRDLKTNIIEKSLIGKNAKEVLESYEKIVLRKYYAGEIDNENNLRIAVGKFIKAYVNNPAFRDLVYGVLPVGENEKDNSFVVLAIYKNKLIPNFYGTDAKKVLKIYNSLLINQVSTSRKESSE